MRRCKSDYDTVAKPAGKQTDTFDIYKIYEQRKLDRQITKSITQEARKRYRRWLKGDLPIPRNPDKFIFFPLYCPYCGKPLIEETPHTHHPWGYDAPNRLNIVTACGACHREIHVLERRMSAQGEPPLSGLRVFINAKINKSRKIISPAGYSVTSDPKGFEKLNKEEQ